MAVLWPLGVLLMVLTFAWMMTPPPSGPTRTGLLRRDEEDES